MNGQVFGASGYRVTLYTHMDAEKTIYNQGPWDLDQLFKTFNSTLGVDLKPPKLF